MLHSLAFTFMVDGLLTSALCHCFSMKSGSCSLLLWCKVKHNSELSKKNERALIAVDSESKGFILNLTNKLLILQQSYKNAFIWVICLDLVHFELEKVKKKKKGKKNKTKQNPFCLEISFYLSKSFVHPILITGKIVLSTTLLSSFFTAWSQIFCVAKE